MLPVEQQQLLIEIPTSSERYNNIAVRVEESKEKKTLTTPYDRINSSSEAIAEVFRPRLQASQRAPLSHLAQIEFPSAETQDLTFDRHVSVDNGERLACSAFSFQCEKQTLSGEKGI